MSVTIIDNHSANHGQYTTELVQNYWNGPIKKLDVGAESVNISEIAELLNEAADKVETWNTIALNLSFGGGLTENPDDSPEEINKAVRRLYRKGVSLCFSAGNNGWGMLVSKLSSHPLTYSIGALDDEGNIATYSNRHPRLVSIFADGHYNKRGVKGTSFSSPLVCGAIADLRSRLNINDLEARTILKDVSNVFTRNDPAEFEGFATYYTLNGQKMQHAKEPKITNRVLITSVYEAFAGRSPDASGLQYWLNRVENGEDINSILEILASGLKYNNDWLQDRCPAVPRIQSLYHLFLGREADLAGVMHYIRKILSIDNEVGTFSTSDSIPENWKEFIQLFVGSIQSETLYRPNLLDILNS